MKEEFKEMVKNRRVASTMLLILNAYELEGEKGMAQDKLFELVKVNDNLLRISDDEFFEVVEKVKGSSDFRNNLLFKTMIN